MAATIIPPGCAIIQGVDAPLVRAYLRALPDVPPDGKALDRVRTCLASLQSPDIRYLVALVLGPGAAEVARVAAAVLRAAGARTATLGRTLDETRIDGAPIDDALLAQAGTLAAAAGYQLRDSAPELGELTLREGVVILALTAFAEASQRVALLVDEAIDPGEPVHAPRPDLVVVGLVDADGAERALSLVPEGRPAVLPPLEGEARARADARVAELGMPALVGGRDHRIVERDGRLEFAVRDAPYVTLDPVPGVEAWALSTGIAAALALGALGIRMREEWVQRGIDSLRAELVAP
jgi:hypothetical protein